MVTRTQSTPRAQATRKVAPTAVRESPVRKSAARTPPAKPKAGAKAPVRPVTPPAEPVKAPKTAKATKAAKPAKAGKTDKAKKPKLVRDSFTIPKAEYEVIAELKLRAAKLGHTPKKSELLRAGVKVLASLGDQALLASLAAVPSIKTGRPSA